MSTTALFVEILIIGTITNIWVGLLMLRIITPEATTASSIASLLEQLSVYLIVPFLALTYTVGWIIHFLSENTIEPMFQNRFKKRFFQAAKVDYEDVRALFYQKASTHIVADLNFDRQVLRISRASVINFVMLAITLLLHVNSFRAGAVIGVICAIGVATISFLHWTTLYKSAYNKMLKTYLILQEEMRAAKGKTPT